MGLCPTTQYDKITSTRKKEGAKYGNQDIDQIRHDSGGRPHLIPIIHESNQEWRDCENQRSQSTR
jgi:hypothetical protein